MGSPAAGAVVLVPFPLSDPTRSRLRPAIILADVGKGDRIPCQVTSNPYSDARAVAIGLGDFATGGLSLASYARPGKLFTASESPAVPEVGVLGRPALERLIDAVVDLLRQT